MKVFSLVHYTFDSTDLYTFKDKDDRDALVDDILEQYSIMYGHDLTLDSVEEYTGERIELHETDLT